LAHAIGNHDLAVAVKVVTGQALEGVSVLRPLRADHPDRRAAR
jgi:hypothetical protein